MLSRVGGERHGSSIVFKINGPVWGVSNTAILKFNLDLITIYTRIWLSVDVLIIGDSNIVIRGECF